MQNDFDLNKWSSRSTKNIDPPFIIMHNNIKSPSCVKSGLSYFDDEPVIEVKLNLYAGFQPPNWLRNGQSPIWHVKKLRGCSWPLNKKVCWISASHLSWKWSISSMSSKQTKNLFPTPWRKNSEKNLMTRNCPDIRRWPQTNKNYRAVTKNA